MKPATLLIPVPDIKAGVAWYIPVVFQVAALLAALTHPGHIVIYAPGDSFLAAALHLEIQWV
ncbi:hypothetical protein [Xenorhabdus koppenhoeferi]|nr:hypothetical protein [Xenorhabdus koppenhoeferi]